MPSIQRPHACSSEDLPQVIALVDSAMREGSDQTMLTDYPLVYLSSNLDNIQVIKSDGKVVSVVPFLPRPVTIDDCRFSIGIISPTATYPEHHRKGYGLGCLNNCIERMDQIGCELSVLWTQVATFPFYECGAFQAVRYQGWTYACRREDATLFQDSGEKIIQYDPTTKLHLEDIGRIHRQDIFGVDRNLEEQELLFGLPKMKTLIALDQDTPVGYLMMSRASNKHGLIEAGGETSALETLVHRALSGLQPEESIEAYDNLSRTGLGALLQRKVSDRRLVYEKSMMIRINQPSDFLRKIAPWIESRNGGISREFSLYVSDAQEQISFRFSDGGMQLGEDRLANHLETTRRELTSWVFGSHPARPSLPPEVFSGIFPFYFPIWILDQS